MAFFSRKKEETKKEEPKAVSKSVAKSDSKSQKKSNTVAPGRNLASTLIAPRITEKAVGKSDQNVYTFLVRRDASKTEIAAAIKEQFDVTPKRVNTVHKAPRQYHSARRGRKTTEHGMKKAYVYLKEGDSIDIV